MATTQADAKPTIVLVPGAWFSPTTYDEFLQFLREAGYPTRYASYPSLDPSEPLIADANLDTRAVYSDVLRPLVEQEGKDVVVVMHSYGGVPGSAASTGLSKTKRTQENQKGGVIGLIHISGFVLPEGASVADGQGGQLPAWVKQDQVCPSPILKKPPSPNPHNQREAHTLLIRYASDYY